VNIDKEKENVPDSVQRVGSKTSTGGDTPSESEGSQERTLERADEDDRLCKVGSQNEDSSSKTRSTD
jgi:hypothetical protein